MDSCHFDIEDYDAFHCKNPNCGLPYNAPLYCLFAIDPKHRDCDATNAKVNYIDKMYKANIGNYVARAKVDRGGDPASDWLARNLHESDEFVSLMKRAGRRTSLSHKSIGGIVKDVSEFVSIIKKLCGRENSTTKGPVSFCSKYLHFHNSAFPIYDRDASNVVDLIWQDSKWLTILRRRNDRKHLTNKLSYAEHSKRILNLLDIIHGVGEHKEDRLKKLDNYLVSCYRRSWVG